MNKRSHSKNKNKAISLASVIFVVLMTAPIGLTVYYQNVSKTLTTQVMAGQQTVAGITSTAIKIKLDQLVGIATSMASSPRLMDFVANGKWNNAADVARDLQNESSFYDPYIDRVMFFDDHGVERAAYPTLSSGVGTNASSTPWYQAMQAGAPFYLSDVSQRFAVPRINVITITAPLSKNGEFLGLLALQIPTADFAEFGVSASLGNYGFIYILDSRGNVITHPRISSNNGLINLTSMPMVQTILAEKQGTKITPGENGAQGIVGYQAVPAYQWEVITQEPSAEAFAVRDSILCLITWEIVAAFLVDLFLACLVLFLLMPKRSNM